MNIPSFKNVLTKLSGFRSNLSLLVPIVIGLVGLLVFIPTQLLSSSLKDNMQRGVSLGRDIQSQSRKAVALEQWQVLAKQQQEHQNDANQIALLSEQTTKRELLRYDLFPGPNDTSPLIFKRFGDRYREGLNQLLARVNANDCPTTTELDNALKKQASSISSTGRGYSSPYSPLALTPQTYGGGRTTKFSEVQATIIDEVCMERAKSCSLYVKPDDIAGYSFWGNYKYDVNTPEAVKDCWYYQIGYWVVEDVLETVRELNASHPNVLTAPVKRLASISFTMGLKKMAFSLRTAATKRGQDEGDRPAYVIAVNDGLTQPCTGRLCNDESDVVHFNVVVAVQAKDVLTFMKQLCSGKPHKFFGHFNELKQPQTFKHNQITILESNVRSIATNDPAHRFYRYGDEPVVELDLICEYILNKKGYEPIKPESVKKTLRGEDQQK